MWNNRDDLDIKAKILIDEANNPKNPSICFEDIVSECYMKLLELIGN